jgi:hypothetical protein
MTLSAAIQFQLVSLTSHFSNELKELWHEFDFIAFIFWFLDIAKSRS